MAIGGFIIGVCLVKVVSPSTATPLSLECVSEYALLYQTAWQTSNFKRGTDDFTALSCYNGEEDNFSKLIGGKGETA
jgi:hypothetical protein